MFIYSHVHLHPLYIFLLIIYYITDKTSTIPLLNKHNQNNTRQNGSCYYDGDKRWHQAGTKWHPYVPPFGYVTCAICSCMVRYFCIFVKWHYLPKS